MKNFLKALIPLLILLLLAACAAQLAEPIPTETPQLPEKAAIVAAFFRAISELQAEEALSYLAEDVRLRFGGVDGICFSGNTARVGLKDGLTAVDHIQRELIGENYRVDGDLVHLDYKEFSVDGSLFEQGSKTYSVSDGLIQWEAPCEP